MPVGVPCFVVTLIYVFLVKIFPVGLLDKLFKKKRDTPITSFADFWNWFNENEQTYYKAVKGKQPIDEALLDLIMQKLAELNDGIFFQIGMLNDTEAELIITADGVISKFMFAKELVSSAPANNRWRFTWLKPPLTFEIKINAYRYKFDETTISFYANDNSAYPDEIDLTIVYHYMNEQDRKNVVNGSLIYLESVLGEWNFATQIDAINVVGKDEAEKELIPINKLRDYINWREKEFVERYEGVRYDTENDEYSIMEATTGEGLPAIFIINRELLSWEAKASHPWIVKVKLPFKGNENGMPDHTTQELMYSIEDDLTSKLKDSDGYLNIGRETANNRREMYFACKEFLLASKIIENVVMTYQNRCAIEYDIYKDKYWRSFNYFME